MNDDTMTPTGTPEGAEAPEGETQELGPDGMPMPKKPEGEEGGEEADAPTM